MSRLLVQRPLPGVRVAVLPLRLAAALPAPESALRSAAGMPRWRAEQHVAARAVLHALLAALPGPDEDTEVHRAPDGRPHLPGRPDLGVSLAHSDGAVAAAIGLGRHVGVDVQEPVEPSAALFARCRAASPGPVRGPMRRAVEFTRVWVVQEACSKATGSGLAGAPWRIPVRPDAGGGRWGGLRWTFLPAGQQIGAVSAGPARPDERE